MYEGGDAGQIAANRLKLFGGLHKYFSTRVEKTKNNIDAVKYF